MKTFKVMLVPNNHQRTRLFQFAGAARFAYNWALQKEREAYAAGEKFIGSNDLRKAFTVLRNSDQYSWLKTISNNVTKQAEIELDKAGRARSDSRRSKILSAANYVRRVELVVECGSGIRARKHFNALGRRLGN